MAQHGSTQSLPATQAQPTLTPEQINPGLVPGLDVSPQNVLVSYEGAVKIADFGIARVFQDTGRARTTASGFVLGTPTYMSPEQASGELDYDGRSDIYSLGCVLYEMLAGQPPFTGRTTQALIARHSLDEVPSLSIVRQTIPEDVEDAVLRALEEMGTWFEWYEPGGEGSGRLYAVDVPPDADWEQVYAYLAAQEEKGVLGWQSSWRGERPDVA